MQLNDTTYRPKSPSTISCVLSDFDGTLVQLFSAKELRSLTEGLFRKCSDLHIEIDLPDTVDPYVLWSGVQRVAEALGAPKEAERLLSECETTLSEYEVRAARKAELLPDVGETLTWLNARRVPVGIVSSNSSRAIEIALKRNHAAETVKLICGREPAMDYTRLKPNPALILQSLEMIGVSPEQALFIGDSRQDMKAARAAGILSFGVATGTCSAEDLFTEGAHEVIPSFSFLPECQYIKFG